MKTMTLTDHQMQQLRCWKALLEVNGGHTFSDEEVLARVLAVSAETARNELVHELGSEDRADKRLGEYDAAL